MDLKLVKELMQQLQDEMKYSPDDLNERLGKKPGIEMVKIEGKMPDLEKSEEMMGKDLDGDHEMGEDPMHKAMVLSGDKMSEMDPDSDMDDDSGDQFDFDDDEGMFKPKSAGMDLKKRLMALRGR